MRLLETNKLNNDPEYKLMSMLDQFLTESYMIIAENINLDHVYEYENFKRLWWRFFDRYGYEHHIRITHNPGVSDKELCVKFWWIKDDKPCYDKPPMTDEMVFNTFMKIFSECILPELENILHQLNLTKLSLDASDTIRYRLYRISIKQVLDTSKFVLEELSEKSILFIYPKTEYDAN